MQGQPDDMILEERRFFSLFAFLWQKHPPVSSVHQWAQDFMSSGQRGVISSLMTTPSPAPDRDGWLTAFPWRSYSPKNRNLACWAGKGLGLWSGGYGFKSHPPAGVIQAHYKLLKSIKLPFHRREWAGADTHTELKDYDYRSAHKRREENSVAFQTSSYGLPRSPEFRKYIWKQRRSPFLPQMQLPDALFSLQNSFLPTIWRTAVGPSADNSQIICWWEESVDESYHSGSAFPNLIRSKAATRQTMLVLTFMDVSGPFLCSEALRGVFLSPQVAAAEADAQSSLASCSKATPDRHLWRTVDLQPVCLVPAGAPSTPTTVSGCAPDLPGHSWHTDHLQVLAVGHLILTFPLKFI